jgi:hypothetical protein
MIHKVKNLCNGMYNRAKYHPYQTPSMREAMKIFSKYLTLLKAIKVKKFI